MSKYNKFNFSEKAFYPCFGLAESAVFLAVNNRKDLMYLPVSKSKFANNEVVIKDEKNLGEDEDIMKIVSSGLPFEEEVFIVDSENGWRS